MGKRLWHDPRKRECRLASLTTLTYVGDDLESVTYSEPAARAARPVPRRHRMSPHAAYAACGGAARGAAARCSALSACSDDPNSIAAQAKSGNRQGYISRRRQHRDDRRRPTARSRSRSTGTTLDDKQWSSQDAVGKVVVLNLWASWCPPCETEAPDLKKAAEALAAADKPVAFMGINYRDNPDSGRSTAARWGIPFPSLDDPSGTDHPVPAGQGHLAAHDAGARPHGPDRRAGQRAGDSASTLTGLVDDVLAEQ